MRTSTVPCFEGLLDLLLEYRDSAVRPVAGVGSSGRVSYHRLVCESLDLLDRLGGLLLESRAV